MERDWGKGLANLLAIGFSRPVNRTVTPGREGAGRGRERK